MKWLADGMEISLAVLSVIRLALTLEDGGRQTVRSAVLAAICVLPELASLVIIVVAAQVLRGKRGLAAATAIGLLVAPGDRRRLGWCLVE